jgi:hypothetical protein
LVSVTGHKAEEKTDFQRLQSVPGFSHFHVFARRKTPEEIDAAEAAVAAAARKGLKADGESVVPPIKA